MNKQGYKRLVCGILAAQLCCAPLAQAAETSNTPWTTPAAMYSRAEERLDGILIRNRHMEQREGQLSLDDNELLPLTRLTLLQSRQRELQSLKTENTLSTEDDKTETPPSEEGYLSSSEKEMTTHPEETEPSAEESETPPSAGGDLSSPEEETVSPPAGENQLPPEGDGESLPPVGEDPLPQEEITPPPTEEELPPPEGDVQLDLEIETTPVDQVMTASAADAEFAAIGSLGFIPYFNEHVEKYYEIEGGKNEDPNSISVQWESGSILNGADYDGYPWDTTDYPFIDLSSIDTNKLRVPNLEFLGWAVRSVVNSEDKYNEIYNLSWDVAANDMRDLFSIIYNGTSPNELGSDFILKTDSFDLNDIREDLLKMAASDGDGSNYYAVQFGGLWEESRNAGVTKLDVTVGDKKIQFYTEDIKDQAAADFDSFEKVDMSEEAGGIKGDSDYYARVNADEDEIKFSMWTYEPGSIVTVEGIYGAVPMTIEPINETMNSEKNLSAPHELENLDAYDPQNSLDNPARGLWEFTVPLKMAEGENQYNDITVVVTPPSGETSDAKTYRFHIQRLNQPQMSYESGNTPAAILGGDADKLAKFQNDWMMINISGLTIPPYDGKFAPEAWGGNQNVDLDEKAIIAYQNSQIVLPKLSFLDSRGMSTDLKGTLKRTLSLKTADPLTTDSVVSGPTKIQYYVDGALQDTSGSETIELDRDEILNLQNMNVVPGVYILDYSYEDEITGLTYDKDGAAFETAGVANAKDFCRTLVVLPIPGDVDMDGHVTAADALALRKLLGENGITDIDPLFLYRVCDANGDGTVDDKDVETLQKGATVQQVNPAWNTSDYFYGSLSSGAEEPERKPMPDVTPGEGGGETRISLEYLGKANDAALPGKDGTGLDQKAEIGVGDSFWMGLKLEGAANLASTVGNTRVFSATLAYDTAYLELYSSKNLAPADLIRAACKASWGEAAECYFPEVLVRDSATQETVDIGMADFGSSDPAKAHPSIGTEGSENGTLRELHVTVVLPADVDFADGYLIQAPFKMTNYSRSGKLVEPVFGPRELCFAGDMGTGVYSMEDSVFGGGTKNIAATVGYGGAEKVLLGEDTTPPVTTTEITYGESLPGTPSAEIKGEPETETFPDWLTCEKDAGLNKLVGTPVAAGTFDFYVGGEKHRIVVHQKELKLALQPQERYYGEQNPAPTFDYDVAQLVEWDREDLTETSSIADKQSRLTGLAGYKAPTATYMESLAEDAKEVTTDTDANTGVATYFITAEDGELQDYKIIYVDEEGEPVEKTTATLTIKRRPILIGEIISSATDPVHTINASAISLRVDNLSGTYMGTSDDNFTVQSPATDGVYNGLPLSSEHPVYVKTNGNSDRLKIGYGVNYERDEGCEPPENFHMTEPVETRDVKVHSLTLSDDDEDNKNYILVNKINEAESYLGMVPVVGTATGQVKKQYAKTLTLSRIRTGVENNKDSKGAMLYTHGDSLHIDGVWAEIHMNDEQPGDPTQNVPSANFDHYGISVFLAQMTADGGPEEERIEVDPRADKLPDVSRTQMNGKYIWISTASCVYDEETKEYVETVLYDHSYYPLTVDQKELTLTIGEEERYYGEANATTAVIRYDVKGLAEMDRDGKTGNFLSDFDGADGYKAPVVKRVETLEGSSKEVTAASNARDYYVTIAQAESTDYKFKYTCTGPSGVTGTADRGYNLLHVYPRPIVVNRITANPQSIFADAEDNETKLTKQPASTDKGEVVLSLPKAGSEYHYQTGAAKEDGTYDIGTYPSLLTMNSEEPLYGDDKLSFTYTAEYKRDREGERPYFNLTAAAESRDVFVTMVELTGTGAGNYVLVFPSTTNAIRGYPGTATTLEDPSGDRQTTGTVKLREVKSVDITKQPKLKYTHGDRLTLNRDSGEGRDALTVKINYGENSGSKSITFTSVENIRKEGIHLTWDQPWTGVADVDDKVEIKTDADLVVTYANHNNRKLFVTLEQMGGLRPVAATTNMTVTVDKAKLELNVVSQNRYYGEENQYEFAFKLDQLADIDLRLAGMDPEHLEKDAEGTGTDAGCDILENINDVAAYSSAAVYTEYKNPSFNTTASKKSEAGKAYALTLRDGALTNYDITYKPGNIRIFRRPILVKEVTAEKVATLSVTEKNLVVEKTLTEAGDGKQLLLDRADMAGSGYLGKYEYSDIDADYKAALGNTALPLSGKALAEGDALTLSFKATFPGEGDPKRPEIPAGASGVECPVSIGEMKLSTESAKNYILVYEHKSQSTPIKVDARGWLGERKINKIVLGSTPSLRFNYGQAITAEKLSEFEFLVNDGSGADARLSYDNVGIEPEIYYWDGKWTIPTTQEGLAALKEEKKDYAVTLGERLTIAKNDAGVSHQGMQLLFLYRESLSSDAEYLPAVVTKLQKGIEIVPKELGYTLKADDKIYDGKTDTSGTLTLKADDILSGDDVSYDTDKIKWNFIDRNVAYTTRPVNQNYEGLEIKNITVEVRDIVLVGEDAANYHINSAVLKNWTTNNNPDYEPGRPDKAPEAKITKAERPAPPALENIRLTTNIHTNSITVISNGTTVGSGNDAERFEYALEYYADGKIQDTTDNWQTSNQFDTEKMGLPRAAWYRAIIRFAESWNYKPTGGTLSAEGDLAALAAEAQKELDAAEAPDPESTPVERPAAPLTRTYTYKLDVFSASDRNTNDSGPVSTKLEATWFTDTAEYQKREDLDWALDNVKNKQGYFDYYWDETKDTQLSFPLKIDAPLTLEIQQYQDGAYVKVPVCVNEDGNLTLYVSARNSSGGGIALVEELTVDPSEVVAVLGDEPVQLTATYKPKTAMGALEWRSSDPSVVTVDRHGLLTFVGVGEAVITVVASYGGVTAEVLVTVQAPVTNKTFLDMNGLTAFMDVDNALRFYPEQTVTRGEAAMILARIFQIPEGEEPGEALQFADMEADAPYAEAVRLLSAYGIITGVENGDFEGERTITRAEIVVMLARMLRLKPEESVTASVFLDGNPEDTWAAPYLNVLYKAGIIQGVGDQYFAPARILTRAEMASFIARIMQTKVNLDSDQLIVPVDVSEGHWAYRSILRAVNSGDALMVESERK